MPPPRRRPATPPSRRPKVAGLHRRPSEEEPERPQDPVAPDRVAEDRVEQQDTGDQDTVWTEPVPPPKPTKSKPADPKPAEPEEPAPAAEEPAASDEPEAEAAEDSDEAEPQRRQPDLTVPVIMVVVALLLGGLGFWFMQNVSDARVGSGNEVLADVNATKDVVGAANTAVTAVLSYKFDDMPGATKRAKEYLVGEAVDQYDKSMKALEADIQNQKLQVVVNPVNVGVVRLEGDDARVLVFADQIGTRADKQPSGGPTQFAMDMRRVDGKWKIVKLDFFENPK